MNEHSSYEQQSSSEATTVLPGTSGHPGLSNPQHKFSPDELRVLNECNSESFFQRSLPLATTLGFGTFVAIQKGHLKPNPRLGVFPKVTLAVMIGYVVGKLSYQQTCAEKLMALPGSYIGQLLRERRDGKPGSFSQKTPPTMFGVNPKDIYSDAGPGSSLDLDTDRPLFNEEAYRSDSPGMENHPHDPPVPKSSMSYDDLRRRNRGEHIETKQDPYRMDQLPPISRRPPPPPAGQNTNKYGDVMD